MKSLREMTIYPRQALARKWRKVWRQKLMRLVCRVLGHKPYEEHGWSGGYRKCSRRCGFREVIWQPIRSEVKNDEPAIQADREKPQGQEPSP